jgi:hypothetical protein
MKNCPVSLYFLSISLAVEYLIANLFDVLQIETPY